MNAPDLEDVKKNFIEFLESQKNLMLLHQGSCEKTIFQKHGFNLPENVLLCDTRRILYFLGEDQSKNGLDRLCLKYDIPRPGDHSAEEDANDLWILVLKLVAKKTNNPFSYIKEFYVGPSETSKAMEEDPVVDPIEEDPPVVDDNSEGDLEGEWTRVFISSGEDESCESE